MSYLKSVEELSQKIKSELDLNDCKKILALYAFNATGKTRLTSEIANENENSFQSLYYSVFLEDIFSWDNKKLAFKFDINSPIINFINEQGLEGQIAENFKNIILSKIEPSFNFKEGEVFFSLASGDDRSLSSGIKISRGEESIFIWSIFYTVLEAVIELLQEKPEDRATQEFNNLEYIIIDDPVSSLDDGKIISIAIKLAELIDSYKGTGLRFLITTHHALFYNVIINSFKRKSRNKKCKFLAYTFHKTDQGFELLKQGGSPFSYHLQLKELIQKAVNNNSVKKYHFNLFRNLLEKTASFLGYNQWSECISDDNNREIFTRLLNSYSHSRLSDLEGGDISNEDKVLFQSTFDSFIRNFKWK